jgi:hypothetical protein
MLIEQQIVIGIISLYADFAPAHGNAAYPVVYLMNQFQCQCVVTVLLLQRASRPRRGGGFASLP